MVNWTPLRQELALWRASGAPLRIWWRDDDAIAPTPALDQLAALSDQLALPVHLAVIPARVQETLGPYLSDRSNIIPVIHGWAHENHSPADQKKAEFGRWREEARGELSAAKTRLSGLFGETLVPMFVPPWNRCAPDYDPLLKTLGYQAISAFTPRRVDADPHGLLRINTHVDPIHWRGTRSLVDPDQLIQQVLANLTDRREGRSDGSEPLGYLTHHLVHDDAIWTFSRNFLSELLDGGAVPADIATLISERT
jgi:hypothetical protein